MGWVVFVSSLATFYLLWDRASSKLKLDGRGWFFRNWAGICVAGIVAIVQAAAMLNGESIGMVAGVVVSLSSLWLSLQPLPQKNPINPETQAD